MKEELLKGLSEEQIAKVKAIKNQEELQKLASEEGIELTDEQLEAVSGGCGTTTCPSCGQSEFDREASYAGNMKAKLKFTCKKCGHVWYEYS